MRVVEFEEAETYEPEEEWKRVATAGSDAFSFEWFTKPPGHRSSMHNHKNEQVCLVLEGELTLYTPDGEEATLGKYDSVWLDAWEEHSVENTGDGTAIGVDVFAPGRSFDFWKDR